MRFGARIAHYAEVGGSKIAECMIRIETAHPLDGAAAWLSGFY